VDVVGGVTRSTHGRQFECLVPVDSTLPPLILVPTHRAGQSLGGILIVLGASGFDLKELRPFDAALIFVAMLL